jgi:hypothetical protein
MDFVFKKQSHGIWESAHYYVECEIISCVLCKMQLFHWPANASVILFLVNQDSKGPDLKILLHDNSITERGTSIAIYDYGMALKGRGHDVTVAFEKGDFNNLEVVKNFDKSFELLGYKSFADLRTLPKTQFDLAYFIKSGENDGKLLANIPSVVHSVFQSYEPHGEVYAYVSEWLANRMRKRVALKEVSKGRITRIFNDSTKQLHVPHMVNIPNPQSNLREHLKIPASATLGVRYGGYDSFDVDFVKKEIIRMVNSDSNLYFCLANTKPFSDHERIIYHPQILDRQYKSDFLGTADFFIHARQRGESFGLSILEALQIGTPVFSWRGGGDRNHVKMLSKASLFRNEMDLKNLIRTLDDYPSRQHDKEIASKFSEDSVMNIFEEVFLSVAR